MDDLFLERAIEPLGDAVGLGLFDEGRWNLIWLVKWSQILGGDSAEVEAYSLASSAEGRRSGRLACTHASRRIMDGVNTQPQPSSTVNKPERRAPHMRLGALV